MCKKVHHLPQRGHFYVRHSLFFDYCCCCKYFKDQAGKEKKRKCILQELQDTNNKIYFLSENATTLTSFPAPAAGVPWCLRAPKPEEKILIVLLLNCIYAQTFSSLKLITSHCYKNHKKYRTCAIITRSWFETALDYKPRILGPKIEGFLCLVKVIYTKYSKTWPYTVAHTIDCVCSKINNSWFNPWFSFYFSSLYPAPYIEWYMCWPI